MRLPPPLLLILLPTVSAASSGVFVEGPWNYREIGKNTALVVGYSGADRQVAIPSSLGGRPVVAAEKLAGMGNVTSVVIPDTMTNIGIYAFYECTALTNVTIGRGVETIGTSAFEGCTGLARVTVPGNVTNIATAAFKRCTALTNVTIGNGVRSIGDRAFNDCRKLARVTIPDSVVSLGQEAFRGCTALTNVTIGNGVKSIQASAFYGCTLLGEVTLPHSVTNIGNYALRGCIALTNVTIGNGVKSIGNFAFMECAALVGVYFKGDMPSAGSTIFDGNAASGTVYYPRGNKTWGTTDNYSGWPTQPYDLPTPQPMLAVEHPAGAQLASRASGLPFPTTPMGVESASRAYTLRNTGNAVLSNIVVVKSGVNMAEFSLTPPASNSLAVGATTTFSVKFSPVGSSGGIRTAQISVTSNATNSGPFVINLYGTGVSANVDTDKDGLNDAAELMLSALGFDWQKPQPDLVGTLMLNANRANLFTKTQFDANRTNGRADVTSKPSTYGLFTKMQYDANFVAGRSAVTSNPTAFNLVSRTNIPAVRLAVPKNAAFTLNLGGTWTRYGLTGRDQTWTFNTNTGELKGTLVGRNERTLRLIPYNDSQAGPQMTIQLRPAP